MAEEAATVQPSKPPVLGPQGLALITSAAAFTLPALALVLPSGYSWGAALLLVAALITPKLWWHRPPGWSSVRWWLAAIVFMGVDWMIDATISQGTWRGLDKPLKYFAAIPCLFFALNFRPRPRALWAGLCVGASATGLLAIYQYVVQGMWRAEGFTNAIQYGNLSLLMALMCLVGVLTWPAEVSRRRWRAALASGVVLGFTASMLSQSRGGWLAIIFVLPTLIVLLRQQVPWRRILGALALFSACAAFILVLLGHSFVARLSLAVQEAQQYETTGGADNSVGQRLAHWKAAWAMGVQKPLLGWSQAGYEAEKARMVAAGEAPAALLVYGHAHNEFLDVFAKRGLVGLSSVLALYGVVLWLFWPRHRCTLQGEVKGLQMAGLTIPLSYLGFGLTQAFLGHNSGTMFYLFMTLLILAAVHSGTVEAAV
jgi:O-antigen ligase